jgi:hypothetical protein
MYPVYQKINGLNQYKKPVSAMTWDEFKLFMGGEADTGYDAPSSLHSYPNRKFVYFGSKYPEINGIVMTGHELNYMGVGAGFAARNYSLWWSDQMVLQYNQEKRPPQIPTNNVYTATHAGYHAYQNVRH